jgi:hypothetical protein
MTNAIKVLLQMQNGFLQLESILDVFSFHNQFWFLAARLVKLTRRISQLIINNQP